MVIERRPSPDYFRWRAEEFRAKADNAEHSQAKETLQKVAKAYDDLAALAQQVRTVQDLKSKVAKMLH